jgi:hypothetical protein
MQKNDREDFLIFLLKPAKAGSRKSGVHNLPSTGCLRRFLKDAETSKASIDKYPGLKEGLGDAFKSI